MSEIAIERKAEFFTAGEVAQMLKISTRHFYRLVDRGLAPRPTRLGAAVRWNRESVLRWIADGCPRQSK